MTEAKITLLKDLLASGNGMVTTAALSKNGFTSRDIKRLVQDGLISKIKQGHYINNGQSDGVSDIEIVSNLIPLGVLCLFSAVDYYELSTVNPTEICIALPRGVTCPILPSSICISIHHMTMSHFEAGITDANINGSAVRIFDVEKTVCDCFKYNNKVEKIIALEVLKNYIAKGHCNLQKLLEYAKLLGKRKAIYPYVEALL